MKYCKKKIVWNILKIIEIQWKSYTLIRTSRINYEKYNKKCYEK